MKSIYNVIGVMSGTSIDGIDLCYCCFTLDREWTYEIIKCETILYDNYWIEKLSTAVLLSKPEISLLNNEYTFFLASVVNQFIQNNNLINIDFVSSHGHTVFHKPNSNYTFQLGNLIEFRNLISFPVVCDFRIQDIQLGGQGAPLVPIGDLLLFKDYKYCINLGGFSNLSVKSENEIIAYDICPVNIVLNKYSRKIGYEFDKNGNISKSGVINAKLLTDLNDLSFYSLKHPKSLGLEWVDKNIFPITDSYNLTIPDILRTFSEHVSIQVSKTINDKNASILFTGGGVKNNFLFSLIRKRLPNSFCKPNNDLIDFKEALIFGFLGVLKIRNEVNCLKSVTGALKDHSSGIIFE